MVVTAVIPVSVAAIRVHSGGGKGGKRNIKFLLPV